MKRLNSFEDEVRRVNALKAQQATTDSVAELQETVDELIKLLVDSKVLKDADAAKFKKNKAIAPAAVPAAVVPAVTPAPVVETKQNKRRRR